MGLPDATMLPGPFRRDPEASTSLVTAAVVRLNGRNIRRGALIPARLMMFDVEGTSGRWHKEPCYALRCSRSSSSMLY